VKSVPFIISLVDHHQQQQGQAPPPPPPPPAVRISQPPKSAESNNFSGQVNTTVINQHYSIPDIHNSPYNLEEPYSADKHKNKNKQKKFNLQNNLMMPPKESLAYASTNTVQSHMARILHFFRQHATVVTLGISLIVFLVILSEEEVGGSSKGGYSGLRKGKLDTHWGGASHAGYFDPQSAVLSPSSFSFTAVTDMDELSRVPDSKKPVFQSFMKPGQLNFDTKSNSYSVELGDIRTLVSKHNEAGRGMELSELTLYQNRLLAFDDRTGSIFELLNKDEKETFVVPRFVITEGDGDTDKGMKWEWATTKGDDLYIGSMGKEYTNPDGSIANTNNLWIAIINPKGEVQRKDWTEQYQFVRGLLGAQAPGYVIHEAVLWSEVLKKWIFIPRRVSSDMYDDVIDERKGTNKVVLVDDKFSNGEVIDIKFAEGFDRLHGFSTAAFVPGTMDRHIAAMRSVEENCVGGDETLCKQRSYMMVFDVLTGDILMDEIEFDAGVKYEGLEFVDVSVLPK
jgi:soluble calcium-activated nucleotidase 1